MQVQLVSVEGRPPDEYEADSHGTGLFCRRAVHEETGSETQCNQVRVRGTYGRTLVFDSCAWSALTLVKTGPIE